MMLNYAIRDFYYGENVGIVILFAVFSEIYLSSEL